MRKEIFLRKSNKIVMKSIENGKKLEVVQEILQFKLNSYSKKRWYILSYKNFCGVNENKTLK